MSTLGLFPESKYWILAIDSFAVKQHVKDLIQRDGPLVLAATPRNLQVPRQTRLSSRIHSPVVVPVLAPREFKQVWGEPGINRRTGPVCDCPGPVSISVTYEPV